MRDLSKISDEMQFHIRFRLLRRLRMRTRRGEARALERIQRWSAMQKDSRWPGSGAIFVQFLSDLAEGRESGRSS